MAKLISVTKEKSLLIFEIEEGAYGKKATYDFKDSSMFIDNKKVGSLQRYFSVINEANHYYGGSSIAKVLDKCKDVNTTLFFQYVYSKNSNCTSFNTMLNRFCDYQREEQWISLLGEKVGGYDGFPRGTVKDYTKHERKKMVIDKAYLKLTKNFAPLTHRFAEELTNWNKEAEVFETGYYVRVDISRTDIESIVELINMGCDKTALLSKLEYYKRYEGLEGSKAIQELKDYIDMNKQMGRTFTKYPRMLRSSHDIVTAIYSNHKKEYDELSFTNRIREDLEYLQKGIRKKVRTMKDGVEIIEELPKYVVTVPKVARDIQSEGLNNHNCVGSYIDSVVKGRTYILFARYDLTPKESLLTLEVKGNKLVQALGNCNRSCTAHERKFLQEWCEAKKLEYGVGSY